MAAQLADFPHIDDDKKLDKFIRDEILEGGLGVYDASKEEIQNLKNSKMVAGYALADIVSRRAQIGWCKSYLQIKINTISTNKKFPLPVATHGHSAVDVNIYGIGAALSKLSSNHENTEVGNFLKDYLELDLDAVTQELLHGGVKTTTESHRDLSWMGRTLEDITNNPNWVTDQMDCYHGEFKREVKGVLHPCGPHQH